MVCSLLNTVGEHDHTAFHAGRSVHGGGPTLLGVRFGAMSDGTQAITIDAFEGWPVGAWLHQPQR